jgi:hypothetical protein
LEMRSGYYIKNGNSRFHLEVIMADRRDYYFRQKVTEAELDAGFDGLEQADFNLAVDNEFIGVVQGMGVSEKSGTPDLSVDVQGPGTAYSKDGERINFSSTQNVDVSQDDGGTPTTVGTPGNTKVVSVFIEFDRALSDARIDGNSLTVYFQRDESFDFSVVQGAEAAIGAEVPPPLDAGKILLADIRIENGTTQILDSATVGVYDQIDTTTRREDAFKFTGGTVEVTAGTAHDAISDLITKLNLHVDDGDFYHAFSAGQNWEDSTSISATTVTGAIDEIVSDLAGTGAGVSGAHKVGSAEVSSSPESLSAGDIAGQLSALLGHINDRAELAGTNTWSNKQTFNNGIEVDNDPIKLLEVDSEANMLLPKILVEAADVTYERICLFHSSPADSGEEDTRIYLEGGSSDQGISVVLNASYNGSNWVQTEGTKESYMLRFSGESKPEFHMYRKNSGASAWNDISWDTTMFAFEKDGTQDRINATLHNARLKFTDASVTGSNLNSSSTPTSNALYAKNICKSWGWISIDASGNVVSEAGFNFYTPSNPGSSADLDITFRTALDDAEFTVSPSHLDLSNNRKHVAKSLATTGFTLTMYNDASGGGSVGHDTQGAHQVGFIVFGTDS